MDKSTAENYTCRAAKPEEVEAFYPLWMKLDWDPCEAYPTILFKALTPGDFRVITRKTAAGSSDAGDSKDELLGCIVACTHGEAGFIGYFSMFPHYRGQGIGTLLLEDSIDYLRKAGCKSIGLDAEPAATKFYTKYGFTKTGSIADNFVRAFNASDHDEDDEIGKTTVMPPGWSISEITPKDDCAFEDFINKRDCEITGFRRGTLLKELFSAPEWHVFCLSRTKASETTAVDEQASYIGVQPDMNGVCLGPMYAHSEDHAAILLEYVKAWYIDKQPLEEKGARFIMAAPVYGARTREMMMKLGWKGGAHFYERMWLGPEPEAQIQLHDKVAIALDSGLG